MTIETKFSIGDEVFYMKDNKVERGTVSSVFYCAIGNDRKNGELEEERVSYGLYVGNCPSRGADYMEGHLFGSKEELLKSL